MLGDQDPTYELLAEKSMPYLNGVIMECLRLHPPVYVLLQRRRYTLPPVSDPGAPQPPRPMC